MGRFHPTGRFQWVDSNGRDFSGWTPTGGFQWVDSNGRDFSGWTPTGVILVGGLQRA